MVYIKCAITRPSSYCTVYMYLPLSASVSRRNGVNHAHHEVERVLAKLIASARQF